MLRRFAQVSALTSLLALLAVPAAHADTHFSFHIGVGTPVVTLVPVAPAPYGYFWQPGYYVRTPFGNRWVPGAWMPSSYQSRGWVPDRSREYRDRDRDDRRWDRDDRRDNRDRNFEHDRRDWRR